MGIVFLVLDHLLGEHGVGRWLREIDFAEDHLQQSLSISEVSEYIGKEASARDWLFASPTEIYHSYGLTDQESSKLRGDTIAGSTRFPSLIGDFLNARGPVRHPVRGMGVDFCYVSMLNPESAANIVSDRGLMEDKVAETLTAGQSGIVLGGATGTDKSYIDLALFDGARSIETLRCVLRSLAVSDDARIHYFTKDKKADSVPIW